MGEMALNGLLDFVGRLPSWLLMGYFWTRMLELRFARWYWPAWLALDAAVAVLSPWFAGPNVTGVAITLSYSLVFPLVFSRGKLWYRLMVIIVTTLLGVVAELVVVGLSTLLDMGIPSDFRNVLDHPGEYAVCQATMFLEFAVGYYLVYCLSRRATGHATSAVAKRFGVGMAAQLALTCAMLSAVEFFMWGDAGLLAATAGFAVASVAVDAAVAVLAVRAEQSAFERQRARALRAELDACLQLYDDVARETQAVARFRHDLRSQLQTVATLVRRGDWERAESLADELQASLGRTADADRMDGAGQPDGAGQTDGAGREAGAAGQLEGGDGRGSC